MNVNRRTQVDRSAATRTALIDAARPLFAEHGFGGVGTETIVRAAGVTRGALYHQFADKTELFAAVFEAVEEDIGARIGEVVAAAGSTDPLEAMRTGAGAWLDACAEPEVQQIVLLDAPAVLGWERWREIGMRHGMGLVEAVLGHGDGGGPRAPPAAAPAGPRAWSARWTRRRCTWPAPRTRSPPAREARAVVDQLIAGFAAGD